ncbi:DUF1697 domain-containing protein [Myroides guanonis]|uniref:Uncharacterized conserved protein, DUF1697 family n=1 Tax=Myroides guanonis TaxID=1150112 RepID=A0A1I3STG6_9FLAO|nr:DUF1697 domain-containing protein [Myroides guanonis]SFJ60756.1 Uncharacterized conserved protein, DUF1697 family [Myroides guanonis]
MKTYIALLKGINVGGKNILKMQSLVKSLESLEFQNISTYIQSGNIVFQSDKESIEIIQRLIHDIIKTEYNLNIPVLVFTFSEWDYMVHQEFFEDKEDRLNASYLTFWSTKSTHVDLSLLDAKKQTEEVYVLSANCFYLFSSNGYSKTKLNQQFLEKILDTPTSTRNLKTCLKIYELAARL